MKWKALVNSLIVNGNGNAARFKGLQLSTLKPNNVPIIIN